MRSNPKPAFRPTLRRMMVIPALLALSSGAFAQVDTAPAPHAETMGGPEARAQINQEQAQFAQEQLDRNAKAQAEYERALQEVADETARIARDDAAAQAAYAEKRAQHEAAVAQWKADVAACKAGDWSRCGE